MKSFNKKKKLNKDNLFTSNSRRLRSSREQLGMSQEELGEEVGLSLNQVRKYEANRSFVGKLYKIIPTWLRFKR